MRISRPLTAAVCLAALALLAAAAPALAADGVPLYPPGVDANYADVSMRQAVMSGPMIGVTMLPIPPVFSPGRIYGWNAADGTNWPVGAYAGLPATADQRHAAVLDKNGAVYYAWQQQDDPATSTWDIWLWKGNEAGQPADGYPMLLVSGPDLSNQFSASLGVVKEADGRHIVLAWLDDRVSAPTAPQVYMLDLSTDANHNGTPDYEEGPPTPQSNGVRVDPSGDITTGQWDPAVGTKGIFWLDRRNATYEYDLWRNVEVWRADLSTGAPVAARFWHESNVHATSADFLHATSTGSAWLRLGSSYAGSGWEPFQRPVGGDGHTVAWLTRPGDFAASGSAYAMTDGHRGATDGDLDICFSRTVGGPAVPVCDVGDFYGGGATTVEQIEPAIATAPGGYRVIWSDSRQTHNAPGTNYDQLAFQLYVALVPTVSLHVGGGPHAHGHAIALGGAVRPNFSGLKVRLQAGERHAIDVSDPDESFVYYNGWKTLQRRTLSAGSKASFSWTPLKAGTYYLRLSFPGGKRYTDVGTRKVPHVANVSKVIKLVVH